MLDQLNASFIFERRGSVGLRRLLLKPCQKRCYVVHLLKSDVCTLTDLCKTYFILDLQCGFKHVITGLRFRDQLAWYGAAKAIAAVHTCLWLIG